jgi:hypothetical protein
VWYEPQYLLSLGAECDPDADFPCPLGNQKGDYPVKPNRSRNQLGFPEDLTKEGGALRLCRSSLPLLAKRL